eukprot:scaffold43777_cov48-Phaeocystis_antarctica.AAC.3
MDMADVLGRRRAELPGEALSRARHGHPSMTPSMSPRLNAQTPLEIGVGATLQTIHHRTGGISLTEPRHRRFRECGQPLLLRAKGRVRFDGRFGQRAQRLLVLSEGVSLRQRRPHHRVVPARPRRVRVGRHDTALERWRLLLVEQRGVTEAGEERVLLDGDDAVAATAEPAFGRGVEKHRDEGARLGRKPRWEASVVLDRSEAHDATHH